MYYLFQDGLGPRYWLGDQTHITALNILSNFTFTNGFNPYWIKSIVTGGWSIAVEMMFYALLPFLFFRIKNLNQAFNFFLLSVVVKIILHLLFTKFTLISSAILWKDFLFLYFPSQRPVFCIGMMFYFVIIEKNTLSSISTKSLLLFTGFLLVQFGIGIPFLFTNHILFGMAFFVLAYALSKYRFTPLVNPVISYIGTISFSVYLVHFAVLHGLNQLNCIDYVHHGILNYGIRFLIVTGLSVLLSSLLHKFIEVQFQELGKKLINKLEAPTNS